MKYLFPNYNEGLTNLTSSIEKYYGLKPSHISLDMMDRILLSNKYKNIVLVLLDGFGYNILKKNKKYCPFLYKYLKCSLSSTFPSTTMAATTSLETGLNPVEHGWLGWDMYFKDYDKVITLFTGLEKRTKVKIADYDIARTLLKYKTIVEKINELDGYNAYRIGGGLNEKNSFKEDVQKVIDITKKGSNNYVFLYYNDPDQSFHKNGCNSKKNIKMFKDIDKNFKRLCMKSKDTLVIGIADHGHIDVDYITLSNYPELINMLKGDISIDNRACSFRVKNEFLKEFLLKLKKVLKDDFIIMSSKEVYDKKLYGIGKENKYYKDALGDFFAIGVSNKSIRYDESVNMHKSSHSGITDDEMLVPLIIYDGGK